MNISDAGDQTVSQPLAAYDPRQALALTFMYRFFQNVIMRQEFCRASFVKEYVRPKPSERILDIGCGPADIVEHLRENEYLGFDSNPRYIESAQKRFGGKSRFFCARVERDTVREHGQFDVILAAQLLHHLNDSEATGLFKLVTHGMKPGGRFVTLDPCFVEGQSPVARFIVSRDRGRHVRHRDRYLEMASRYFEKVESDVRHDLLRLPFTFLVMKCSSPRRGVA